MWTESRVAAAIPYDTRYSWLALRCGKRRSVRDFRCRLLSVLEQVVGTNIVSPNGLGLVFIQPS